MCIFTNFPGPILVEEAAEYLSQTRSPPHVQVSPTNWKGDNTVSIAHSHSKNDDRLKTQDHQWFLQSENTRHILYKNFPGQHIKRICLSGCVGNILSWNHCIVKIGSTKKGSEAPGSPLIGLHQPPLHQRCHFVGTPFWHGNVIL